MLRTQKCGCASGLDSEWYFDARGIEICRACVKCWPAKKARYRPEVLSDPHYVANEPIEAED
jgi:hypothetical protein